MIGGLLGTLGGAVLAVAIIVGAHVHSDVVAFFIGAPLGFAGSMLGLYWWELRD